MAVWTVLVGVAQAHHQQQRQMIADPLALLLQLGPLHRPSVPPPGIIVMLHGTKFGDLPLTHAHMSLASWQSGEGRHHLLISVFPSGRSVYHSSIRYCIPRGRSGWSNFRMEYFRSSAPSTSLLDCNINPQSVRPSRLDQDICIGGHPSSGSILISRLLLISIWNHKCPGCVINRDLRTQGG
nr:hypothetical protein CFP56_25711 [Quercus suber]